MVNFAVFEHFFTLQSLEDCSQLAKHCVSVLPLKNINKQAFDFHVNSFIFAALFSRTLV